jgi:hypothetical protein
MSASESTRYGDRPEGHLSHYFFDYGQHEIAYTTIAQTDENAMLVESFEAGEEPLTRLLKFGQDYTCGDGRLWVAEPLQIEDDGLALTGRERIGFASTESGALVGKSIKGATGHFYVIPLIAREKDHFIWEPHGDRVSN